MKIEMLFDNKKGDVYDISELVTEVSWKTQRKDKPSTLEFKYLQKSVTISNGDVISFKVSGNKVFYGYVFENSGTKDMEVSVTAYDQIRYLLSNDTFVAKKKTAAQILKMIASSIGLRVGTIEDTKHVITKFIQDDKKLLDMIYNALDKTLMATGKTYTFYDDFGALTLKNINNMKQTAVISDDSNLSDYDWKNTIDSATYNRIKFVKDNKKRKGRDVYIAQDSNKIAKWGRLQYYYKVDDDMNKAQIVSMLNETLALKNREEKTLSLKEVIGTDVAADLKLRAGAGVYIDINKKKISQYYLIESATHKFTKDGHTMDFELKVV